MVRSWNRVSTISLHKQRWCARGIVFPPIIAQATMVRTRNRVSTVIAQAALWSHDSWCNRAKIMGSLSRAERHPYRRGYMGFEKFDIPLRKKWVSGLLWGKKFEPAGGSIAR